MQVILPRVQSIREARETIVHKEDNNLHQQQMTGEKNVQKKMKQVNKQTRKEEEKIKDERRSADHHGRKRKKKRDNDGDEAQNKEKSGEGGSKPIDVMGYHRFDMKV